MPTLNLRVKKDKPIILLIHAYKCMILVKATGKSLKFRRKLRVNGFTSTSIGVQSLLRWRVGALGEFHQVSAFLHTLRCLLKSTRLMRLAQKIFFDQMPTQYASADRWNERQGEQEKWIYLPAKREHETLLNWKSVEINAI
jgi:hypothetical protein